MFDSIVFSAMTVMLQVTERMLTLEVRVQYNQQFCIQIWQISHSFLYKMIEDTLKEGKV